MQNFFTTKNVIIIAVIMLLIAGGTAWYFFSKQITVEPNDNGSGENTNLPISDDSEEPSGNNNQNDDTANVSLDGAPLARVQKIVSAMTAGAGIKKDKLRYIERQSGAAFEVNFDGSGTNKISNTTILGIFESAWANTGERAIIKYMSKEYLRVISANYAASSTEGTFLSSDLRDAVFSPKGDRISYVLNSGDEAKIIIATADNKNQRTLFKTPFSSWRIFWPEEKNIYILRPPTANENGFLYRINAATGAFEKILGPRKGLTISTDGKWILFSETTSNNAMMVSALDLKTKDLKQIPLAIIPEKCVWSKKEANEVFCAIPKFIEKGTYPDDWYKGIVSFEDSILKLNLSTLKTSSFGLTDRIDAVGLLLPEDESKIFFTNKKDGSIWKADLK